MNLDAIFNKQVTKYKEVVEEIVKMSKIGRPVLVGTISIEKIRINIRAFKTGWRKT